MKKKLALLLALSILPSMALASYEPDANYWNWYRSTDNYGYFVSKEPVYKISDDNNILVLRGYIQLVYGFKTPANTKYSISNFKATFNQATGERTVQLISGGEYFENKKIFEKINEPGKVKAVEPNTIAWWITQALLDTYNAQNVNK